MGFPTLLLLLLLLLVKSNEHADNPGAAIGNKDEKLFLVFVVVVGTDAGTPLFISLTLIDCNFFVAVSFGLPRFLCLMSIQVSHLSKAVHRLHGLDTIIQILISYAIQIIYNLCSYNHRQDAPSCS